MISEIVKVPPGDNQSPDDIVDAMIVTKAMAGARGRWAIGKSHKDRVQVSGTGALRPYMRPGSIVLYTDRHGNQYRCLLQRSPFATDRATGPNGGFTATTNIMMEYKTDRRR